MNSLLLINNATVFIESDIADHNYEFQKGAEGTYTDWVKGWNKSETPKATVHTLKWEFEGSFQWDLPTVSVNESSEEIGQAFDLGDDFVVLGYYEPELISEMTPNVSYSSFYFSLECLYNAGALDEKIFEYFNNEVFYPDFAKGFFFPNETLFCEWGEGTDEYFQHQVCEQIFNEFVARDYLRFYRPKIEPQSIEISYSPDCAQTNATTETLKEEFIEFIQAGYHLAVFKSFPPNVGKEIVDTLPIEAKQWLAKIEIQEDEDSII